MTGRASAAGRARVERALAAGRARVERIPRRTWRRIRALVLAGLVLAVAAAGLLAWQDHRRREADSSAAEAVAAAKTRAGLLLSYDHATLDADLARGRAQVTGAYAAEYEKTATELIAPATRAGGIDTAATVVRSALVRADPDRVQALLYVDQTSTSTVAPAPRLITSQILVTMTRVGDQWLISGLQPV